MKQQLFKITKLLALLLLIALAGCEKDLYEDAIADEHNLKIEKFAYSNIKNFSKKGNENPKMQQLFEAINKAKIKLVDKKNLQGKLVYDSNLGIYFDDEAGLKITKDDIESYTFKIFRDSIAANSKLENIIFSQNQEGGFDSYLVKYPISEEEMKTKSDQEILNIPKDYYIINRNTVEILCVTISTYGGCNETHSNGYTCSNASVDYICQRVDGGGTGVEGSNQGSSTGGSSTQNGNNGGSVSTTPVYGGGGGGGGGKIPCTLIQKLKIDSGFKTRMSNLKDASQNWGFEKLFTVYKNPTPTPATGNYNYTPFQGSNDTPEAGYSGDSTMQGIIHSHYQGLISIFSPGDLQNMYNLMSAPDITSDFFYGVVTAEGAAYILQVIDRDAFIAFGNTYLSNERKFDKFTRDTYDIKYNIRDTNSKQDNEKNFITMMTDLGTGLSLAGTTYAPTTPSSANLFSNLQIKTISDMTFNVENTNCN